MESDQIVSRQTEIADVETLRELIARLNEVENWHPITRPEAVTVEDVAEALHLDPHYVAAELERIHEEHREARLAGTLRELEEPLYRVERTGHTPPDPLGNPLMKMRSVQLLAERSKSKPVLARREETPTFSEKFGHLIGYAMLILIAILIIAVAGKVAVEAIVSH
ncbi:MAG: hypothetical protein JST12_07815 [Armatimonadetes bacterium]|nr:hypothetical protein [Armatimonadota bacterium]